MRLSFKNDRRFKDLPYKLKKHLEFLFKIKITLQNLNKSYSLPLKIRHIIHK